MGFVEVTLMLGELTWDDKGKTFWWELTPGSHAERVIGERILRPTSMLWRRNQSRGVMEARGVSSLA